MAAATTTTKKKYVSYMKYSSDKQYKLRLNRTSSLRRAHGTVRLYLQCFEPNATISMLTVKMNCWSVKDSILL